MAVERVVVDVLGPLRSRAADGTDRTPDGALQRRLLALLVLRRGHVVTADAAVDALWPDRPPQDPVAALQSHVSRLRRCLPEGAIASVADGYRLDPAAVEVDADRLTDLLDRLASGADPAVDAEAAALLDRWHGPAYPELGDVTDGRAEAARLDDLRTALVEARAARRQDAGDLEGLVAELTSLVQADPLRERPVELLMGALAASGRRADALRAYDGLRRRLGDELGIEPSAPLTAHHAELLSGEPPPAPPRSAVRHHLPSPPSTLIGRESSLADALAAVERHRVVTLVGPGGVGKTRLLLEVGHRLHGGTGVPVVLCELAPADPATAADAVATALGIDARPRVPAAERIAEVVGDRELSCSSTTASTWSIPWPSSWTTR